MFSCFDEAAQPLRIFEKCFVFGDMGHAFGDAGFACGDSGDVCFDSAVEDGVGLVSAVGDVGLCFW